MISEEGRVQNNIWRMAIAEGCDSRLYSPTLCFICNLRTGLCLVLWILASETLLFIVVEKCDGVLAEERDGDKVARCHYHHEEIDQCPYDVDGH